MLVRGKIGFTPAELVDLANYCYDRQQSTPFDERSANRFVDWISDWLKEGKKEKAKRNSNYIARPETRTDEYHQQLARLAESLKLVSSQ